MKNGRAAFLFNSGLSSSGESDERETSEENTVGVFPRDQKLTNKALFIVGEKNRARENFQLNEEQRVVFFGMCVSQSLVYPRS
jgi:hypothetical protein